MNISFLTEKLPYAQICAQLWYKSGTALKNGVVVTVNSSPKKSREDSGFYTSENGSRSNTGQQNRPSNFLVATNSNSNENYERRTSRIPQYGGRKKSIVTSKKVKRPTLNSQRKQSHEVISGLFLIQFFHFFLISCKIWI